MDPEEQRRRDEEARRAVEEELAAAQMAFDAISRGGAPAEAPEADVPAGPPLAPNRRFEGAFEPSESSRIQRVDERLRADMPGVDADLAARRDPARQIPAPQPGRMLAAPQPARPMPQASDLRQPPAAADLRPMPVGGQPAPAAVSTPRARPQPSAALSSPVVADAVSRKPALASDAEARRAYLSSQGLPSEGDVRREEALDVPRGILYALAEAARGFTGQGSQPFSSGANRLRERQAEGLQRGSAAKREQIQEGRLTRAQDIEERGQEMEAAESERESEIARMRAESESRYRQAQERLAAARTAREQIEAARLVEQTDPASPRADQMRTRYALRARQEDMDAGRPGQPLEAYHARVQGLGADVVAEMTEDYGTRSRGLRGRAAGAGGPPRPVAPGIAAASGAQVDRLVAEGVLTEANAGPLREALSSPNARVRSEAQGQLDDLRSMRPTQTERSEAAAGRPQYLPGVEYDPNLVPDPVSVRMHREGLIAGRRSGDAMRRIRDVANRMGVGAVISPSARAELAAPLQRMLTHVGEMRNSGVITPSEVPTIQAFLPDPTSGIQMTIGDFNARLQSFLADVDDDVRATLEADGTSPEGIARALRYIHSEGGGGGGGRGAARSAASRFTVTAPGREPQVRSREWLEQRGFIDDAGNLSADAQTAGITLEEAR